MQKARSKVSREVWIGGALLTLAWLVVYLATVSPTVNFIDSGELIAAVHEPGVVHPPGYPLYTLLGYVVSHVPVGRGGLAGERALGVLWRAGRGGNVSLRG